MRVLGDIPYSGRQGIPLALDLYLPETPAQATVLHAHGGGFFKGHRRAKRVRPLAERLTQQGLALASVSYRLATPPTAFTASDLEIIRESRKRSLRQGVSIAKRMLGPAFEAARQDIGTALSFLRLNHSRYDIQSDKVAVLGISAGGIAGFSLAYPPANLPQFPKPDAVVALGATMVQPWEFTKNGPPALLIHSQQDNIIAPGNAQNTFAAAQMVGAPVTVLTCERKGHNAPVQALLQDDANDELPYWDHMTTLFETAGLISP
ncbi:hypothetical protein [Shimia sp.]|uniref:alpha/beta hydrolase n=1 Tax=Shimia sp. TaxID=1954381 RepID=UPI003297D969